MVGRLAMSACAGQRTSGEASGWVWWSSSRTDWNHGHGCSHGDGASQPMQQGSTVQLLNKLFRHRCRSVRAAHNWGQLQRTRMLGGRTRSWMGTRTHVWTVSPCSAKARLSNPERQRVNPQTLGRTPYPMPRTPYPILRTHVAPPPPLDGYTPYPGRGRGGRTPLYPIPQYPLHGVQRLSINHLLDRGERDRHRVPLVCRGGKVLGQGRSKWRWNPAVSSWNQLNFYSVD